MTPLRSSRDKGAPFGDVEMETKYDGDAQVVMAEDGAFQLTIAPADVMLDACSAEGTCGEGQAVAKLTDVEKSDMLASELE